jgi:hypothetical protein
VAKPVIEDWWLICQDPESMLSFLRDRGLISDRKLKLFAVACCRRVWHLMRDERSRGGVEMLEQIADGRGSRQGLREVVDAASEADQWQEGEPEATWAAATAAAAATSLAILPTGSEVEFDTVISVKLAAGDALGLEARWQEPEKRGQDGLVRHLFGNPWRPLTSPAHWPLTIVKLAEAQYAGEDCSAALHDALVEEGQSDFAQHFREAFHPKGCAWLDTILGKS